MTIIVMTGIVVEVSEGWAGVGIVVDGGGGRNCNHSHNGHLLLQQLAMEAQSRPG